MAKQRPNCSGSLRWGERYGPMWQLQWRFLPSMHGFWLFLELLSVLRHQCPGRHGDSQRIINPSPIWEEDSSFPP